ncbi:MAG: DUF5696 domain-containing protein [Oscillospiraceae bacterium]|jgi:hypothetical protein|nr:DUF5696 domain-containing protein [Oscillospiraceae bacterium]
MKLGTKLLLTVLGVAALVILIYQGYLQFYYRMYGGYKQYLEERGAYYEEGRAFAPLQGGGNVPGMVLAAENGFLQLYTDLESTNAAVYDKRSGLITYVCPPDADEDPIASGLNKSILKSPLTIDFFNARRTPGRYNVYDYAIKDGQFRAESLDGGLRYVYTLGDLRVTTGIVPLYIHRDRLDFFLDRVEDPKDREYVEMRYIESEDAPEGFWELFANARGAATVRKLLAIFEGAGYTEEDWLEDSLASGVEGAVTVSFEVPLEYRLDGDSLKVSVPTHRIVETGGARIYQIQFARSLGAAGTGESGYLLVPNGSGSLIRFNNGKDHAEEYSQYLYGQDPMDNEYTVLGNNETARMPVFGIYREGGPSVFAQIEEGHTFVQLAAAVSGRTASYNSVYPTFIVRGSLSLYMFGNTGTEAEMPVVEANIYNADLTVRYSFLDAGYDGYSGMARYYRERLIREGALGESAGQGDIPLYMDMVGAVTGTKFMLSVQYQGSIPMTTYAQAAEIVDLFREGGVSNQVVNYQGWLNRGYFHDAANRIILVRQLGSRKKFEDLSAKLEAQGGKLYADVLFQNVPYNAKRYNYAMENSRYYGGNLTGWWAQQIDPVSYTTYSLGYPETWNALISPKFLPRYVDAFTKRFEPYNVTGVSLRDLGDELHSDRKRTELIDREQSLDVVKGQLEKIAGMGKDVMVSGGNLYALPYADDLINISLEHSDFYIVDEEVPFYQMVIHGYIPYAGYAVNHSDAHDRAGTVLRLLETGASPHFTFTYEEASGMKYTGLNRFYGTYYQNWVAEAMELYHTVNPILSRVSGSAIVRHEIMPDGLRCVTYDNGIQILVNYTGTDLSYGGLTVSARGFAVREGAAA